MLLSGTEYWNLPRLPRKGPHIETYALRFTDLKQAVAMAYRQSLILHADGTQEAALRITLHDLNAPENLLVLSERRPLQEARVERDIFYFAVAGGELYHNGSHGFLAATTPKLEWQLRWEPAEQSFRYLPLPFLYKREQLVAPRLVAPNPDIKLQGWLRWNGREYRLNQTPAHQYHLWGPSYPEQWCWG